FDPSHGSLRKRKIRECLIPKTHLFDGEASVWRIGGVGIPLGDLIEKLKGSRSDPLFAVLAVQAKDIRDIRLGAIGPRAFCLVDECECDADGNKLPAHA